MTLLITAGVLDLSVPGVIALSSLAAASLLPYTTTGIAVGAALLVGALAGLLNGLLVAYVKIPSFIATLGTQYLYLGIVFVLTDGGVAPINSNDYSEFTNGSVGVFPLVFIILIVLAALTYFVLYWTHFGRAIRAIGSNERAARLTGVSVNVVKVIAFVIGGLMFAIAGVFLSGELSSSSGTMATGFELNAIAAVVVGGTSLRGGQATMFGTVIGAMLFSLLSNALNLLNVSSYWQYVLTGAVLAVAVALGGTLLSSQQAVRGAD
jgi:ribose transport system permease protein